MSEWAPPPEFDGYRVVGPLGRGGMGRVFLGQDVLLERPVAVKFIASVEPSTQGRERFLLEARAIARLSHPNVVTVYRVGEVQGHPYLVAEFIRGQSLSKVPKPLPADRVLEVGIGLARGLAAAHRQGILHRDIKPSNVILSESGEIKLLDFGLAKLIEDGASRSDAAPMPHSPTDSTLGLSRRDSRLELTQSDVVLGTPKYMAPEVLAGEAATRRSDVFSLGAVLFELCSGEAPERRDGAPVVPVQAVAPGVPPTLATAVDRCLATDPSERFASADQLLDALDRLKRTEPAPASTEGNPYRGLRPFEAEHQSLFFGREVETRAVVERLRSDPLVVVAGDSGVGKSSLCRAGVLPLVASGALGEGRRWVTPQLVPGRSPLVAMARVLAPIVGTNEEALAAWISTEPSAIARAFQQLRQRRPDIGLVVFMDQTEELFTLAPASEANLVGQALAALASIPAARVLAAVRGDFVTRLAALGGLGESLSHSLYLLRPLTEENLRQVILGPASTRGVAFETDAMLETLVASARTAPGGLPLLQFALAELWDARDLASKLIPAAALEGLGGVEGGLARHADTVIASLSPEQRVEARRILLRLVTAEGTRARRTRRELGAESSPAKEALDALVNGRLLVVRDSGNGAAACELAHEALVDGWGTLRDWLAGAAEDRRIRERLEAAAGEWQRLGHSRDVLWHGRQLHEASRVDTEQLGQREAAFLASSRRAALWARVGRAALLASGPLLFALALVVSQIRGRHQVTGRVDENLRAGTAALEEARRVHSQASERARAAFALYDGTAGKPPGSPLSPADVKWDEAEAEWGKARNLRGEADLGYLRAIRLFESGLLLDGRRDDVKKLRETSIYDRLTLAEERYRDDLVSELGEQLVASDSKDFWARTLRAQGTLSVSMDPPTSEVTLERYVNHSGRFDPQRMEIALEHGTFRLAPGSYRLTLRAPGRALVRYPFVLKRGESASVVIRLPDSTEIPPGFVFVPAGTSLFGSGDEESLRLALDAPPLHPVHTAGFFIAQNEFTLGDWLRGIVSLPAAVASRLTPGSRSQSGSFSAEYSRLSGWRFIFNNGARTYQSRLSQNLIYQGRYRGAEQRSEMLPVFAVSPANAVEFAAATRRGLRLCSEDEWERAARGADGRTYSTGNVPPGPNEANFDLTYGRISDAYGPDEVGRHPESDSPFDLHDVDGNVLEIVRSARGGGPIEKGGGWYFDVNFAGRLARHGALDVNTRTTFLGVRWCLDVNQ